MKVLHVAAEAYPLIKTGGLADVAFALPRAQKDLGTEARLLLPGYPSVLAGIENARTLCELGCVMGAARVRIKKGKFPLSGVDVYVIDAPSLYGREGNPYLGPDRREWPDNHRRYALLSWVAAHLAAGEIDLRFRPDVVHAHDWHTGLTPAYMAEIPGLKARCVFTVHNIAYRGDFPMECMPDLGLSPVSGVAQHLEFWGRIAYLKAGVSLADKVTTVSPTYAREVLDPQFGFGMEGVLASRGGDFEGVLNGLDYGVWNPETDPEIAQNYTGESIEGKQACRKALREEFGLDDVDAPLFGVVSRLVDQKGLDLVLEAIPHILDCGAQLLVLGSGDERLEEGFRAAARAFPGRIAVYIGYNEKLSHRLIAGVDALFVPSRFEPCGLTQIMALRYGTLPVVRETGGLADTIAQIEGDWGTGFRFRDPDATAVCYAIDCACGLYADKNAWKAAQLRAMSCNFSWESAARRYEDLYRSITG